MSSSQPPPQKRIIRKRTPAKSSEEVPDTNAEEELQPLDLVNKNENTIVMHDIHHSL